MGEERRDSQWKEFVSFLLSSERQKKSRSIKGFMNLRDILRPRTKRNETKTRWGGMEKRKMQACSALKREKTLRAGSSPPASSPRLLSTVVLGIPSFPLHLSFRFRVVGTDLREGGEKKRKKKETLVASVQKTSLSLSLLSHHFLDT